ncbi:4-hydroxybenzoate polyprenyltransferase [Streptomyces sp. Ag109_O5-1]|uniref:UbiA prenyltransferase family protein n=1 Tax=Streptomyces sp. Ag109_O5-1 TaxID=1938851 RepID=UPI000F9577E0|nr:UbiA prenyltransferase family protein [Streptomyces sp. Ag109_O5-1]RPE38976.1 4-hydroxybenzoate polyprenyltransferase [Streptomyces sp. Ag109_O5-1]
MSAADSAPRLSLTEGAAPSQLTVDPPPGGVSAPPAPHLLPPDPLPYRRGPVRAFVALARPKHWVKNIFVIALPVLLTGQVTPSALRAVGVAVALFITASVSVYVLNDLVDRERDRLHPVKRHRPLAAGELSARAACVALGVLAAVQTAGVLLGGVDRYWPVPVYLALNVAYSFRLKHLPIVDVFALAGGFVLRAIEGYLAPGLTPSAWLLMCVFTLCLVLALGKRRRELSESGSAHRPALTGYTTQLLDYMVVVSASLSVMIYVVHLFVPPSHPAAVALILVTVPCAIFALFRYLQAVLVHGGGGDPVRLLLSDRVLMAVGLLWAVVIVLLPAPA